MSSQCCPFYSQLQRHFHASNWWSVVKNWEPSARAIFRFCWSTQKNASAFMTERTDSFFFFLRKKNVFSLMRPFRRKKLWSRLNNVVWHRTKLRRIRIHQGKSTHPPPNTWWCLKILAKGTIVTLKSFAKEDWNVSERRDRGSERQISHRRKCFLITSSKVSIKVITLS